MEELGVGEDLGWQADDHGFCRFIKRVTGGTKDANVLCPFVGRWWGVRCVVGEFRDFGGENTSAELFGDDRFVADPVGFGEVIQLVVIVVKVFFVGNSGFGTNQEVVGSFAAIRECFLVFNAGWFKGNVGNSVFAKVMFQRDVDDSLERRSFDAMVGFNCRMSNDEDKAFGVRFIVEIEVGGLPDVRGVGHGVVVE